MIKGLPLACVFSWLSYSFEGTRELFRVTFAQQKLRGLTERKAGLSNQPKGRGSSSTEGEIVTNIY